MEEYIALYKKEGYVGFGIMPKYVWYFLGGLFFVLVCGSWAAAWLEKRLQKS
jgi:hypothetical protein